MNPIRCTPAALALAACSHLSLAGALNPDETCQDDFDRNVEECGDSFGPDGTRPDENAKAKCLEAADDGFVACLEGADRNDLLDAWLGFISDVNECIDREYTDPDLTEACINGALILYRHRVEEALGDEDDACARAALPGTSARIHDLADAQHPARDIDIRVGEGFSFGAGTGVASTGRKDFRYDVREVDCVHSAMLFEAYRTRSGAHVQAVDADTDMTDGVRLDYHANAARLVDARAVRLFVLYRDDRGVPRFLEQARLDIRETGVAGDWNRDGAADENDLIDFLGSYNAGVPRADLDGDGSVGVHDAARYLGTISEK